MRIRRLRVLRLDAARRFAVTRGALASAAHRIRRPSPRRPERATWSAIEYAADSRDVTALHAYGVEQAITHDEPTFPPIGDDLLEAAATAYGDADPDEVVKA